MDAQLLKGEQVAFTGKLASMTRQEAADLVRAFGGKFTPDVTRRTSLVVVGHEGWPLRNDGRLTRKLQKAQLILGRGHPVRILSEEQFLDRLGAETRSAEIRRLYSIVELSELLGVPGDRLRAWMNAELIRPVESRHGIALFDFRQVAGAKTLCELVKAGVAVKRIRESLDHLRAWAGDIEQPLSQLAILERDGVVLVRVGETLAEPTGQLLLNFDEDQVQPAVEMTDREMTAEEWFELACCHEDAGRLTEAEAAYRKVLFAGGPDALCCFNLANVLYALDRKAEAAERYYQAVELDGQDPDAWNNLGNVLVDLGRMNEAIAAYHHALRADPRHADTHYNLADALEQLGRTQEAAPHWESYLRQDRSSRWASFARKAVANRFGGP